MSDSNTTYYYANGQRVPLTRRNELVAVKFKDSIGGTNTRSSIPADILSVQAPLEEDFWPGGEIVLRFLPSITRSAHDSDEQLRELNQRADVEYASPVYEYGSSEYWIATNEFVAQFKQGIFTSDIAAINDSYHVEIVERVDWAPRTYVLRVTAQSPGDALAIANLYVEAGRVVFAHPNFLRKQALRIGLLKPNAQLTLAQWHLSAISAFEAWQISTGVPSITIAIIDDGVDLDHMALANQTIEHFNVIDGTGNPRPPHLKGESYTHGTACAGLAVGKPNEDVGTSGVAPGCRLMAVRLLDRIIPSVVEQKLTEALSHEEMAVLNRTLGAVQPYREAKSIQWAVSHGADVISNSWGPPDGYAKFNIAFPIDDIVRLAVDLAAEKGRDGKGCIICWAAGNGNESISFDGYACHPQALAIAACTADGKRAPYSDYGSEVALCAPGGGYSDDLLTTVAVDREEHKAYRYDFNGTSAAAPIVAGVAALILSISPNLTREEVSDILRSTADRIDPEGGEYDSNGHSPYYGFGRVNARRALDETLHRK
jgi:subtilisin family serine protease